MENNKKRSKSASSSKRDKHENTKRKSKIENSSTDSQSGNSLHVPTPTRHARTQKTNKEGKKKDDKRHQVPDPQESNTNFSSVVVQVTKPKSDTRSKNRQDNRNSTVRVPVPDQIKDERNGVNKSATKKTSGEVDNTGSGHGKHAKIPIRRCASIDVGELGRKKKGKRKKSRIDKEALLAPSQTNLKDGNRKDRSGSVGNRPNSLKLSHNSSNTQIAFPTPLPTKRHSSSTTIDKDRKPNLNSNSNYISSEYLVYDKSPRSSIKSQSRPKQTQLESISIDFTESDDEHLHQFPTVQGYHEHGKKCEFPSAPFVRLKAPVIQRTWLKALGLILYSIGAFFVFCPAIALLLVFMPICIIFKVFIKCCCCCCCRRNQGETCVCCMCGQRVSITEKYWIENEVRGSNVVQSLVIVEYGLSVAQIVNLINNRLVLVRGDDGQRLYPRFTQKIVQTCSQYVWTDDPEFFIHNHVFSMPKGIESLEDLQDYVSDMASKPIEFEKPLWEVQMLSDFGDARDTVLLFRMHPSLTDGVSMVKILYKSIADVDSTTTVPPKMGNQRCLQSLKSMFYGPIVFFKEFLCAKSDFNSLHGKHIHLSGKKVITWSQPYSLSAAVKIKQVTRSTLNEVLMSVAAGSIRNYLILNGVQNPYNINSSIPVYCGANKHASGIGNNVILLNVTIPTNTEGVVPRLWQMKEYMAKVRQSALLSLTKRLFKLSSHMLTEGLWSRVWRSVQKKCTCIISSLPGPEIALRLSSRQIKTIFYWFPPVHKVALAISFFTYGDDVQMAVSSDRNVLPNPEILTNDFIYQMQNLFDQLGQRRIPGEMNKKVDLTLLNNEIRPEETVDDIQHKMSMIHQEVQNLKHKLDARRHEETEQDHKIMKKIENLKEQFREYLVELRKRRAAESESAISFDDDSTEDDDEFDLPRRPFRRRAMSVSSRLSSISVSSTIRPLTAACTPAVTPDFSPDSPLLSDKQVPYTSYTGDRRTTTLRPYSNQRGPNNRQTMQEFEILEYQYSPSLERRYKVKH